jgi:signal transduction histidine kinase/DNA-binding response OmpR family regulator
MCLRNIQFEEVKKQHFQPNEGNSFRFSFSQKVFWFRFQVDNQSKLNRNNWYFLWGDGLSDNIDIYIPQENGQYQCLKGGLLASSKEKAYSGLFPIYKAGFLPQNKVQTYYIRLKASGSVNAQLTLMTHQTYIDQIPGTLAMVWLVIGIQLLRVLYNIILARYIRNTSFRWYAFHTVIVTISVLGSFGVVGSIFSSNPPLASFLNDSFYQLMPATYTLFIFSLLNIRKNFPKVRWIFFFIIACSVLEVIAHVFVPKMYLLIFNNYLFLFTEAFLSIMCIYALYKRISMNTYLLIPCFITLVPFVFLNLSALGFINYGWIYPMIYITNFLEILALALVLGKIIQTTENERISSEKALYEEKIEAEKLQELDAAKTQFFTNISHEFRTPLTLILSPIDDLSKKYPTETLFDSMKRNAQRLLMLINQLLDLSKLDSGQMTMTIQRSNLAKFVQVLASSFSSVAESRSIDFKIIQNRKEAIAYFDADKVEKILVNLISNAFKFTKDNGEINVLVNYSEDFSSAEIIVKDSGIGISAQKANQIFDRFYQIDGSHQRNYEGSGIGLALVKEMVSLHKGTIRVESTEGVGTSFYVNLPINKTTWQQEVLHEALEENKNLDFSKPIFERTKETFSDKTKINDEENILLIIEDNTDLRQYICSVFEQDYQILEAIDGQDGIEKALKFIPDIVVCDLMMPHLDGFGFCKLLKSDETTSHIPVVMLTAKANIESKIEGFELGADDYLTKPFNKEELLVRVNNLVTQRTLLRQKYDKQIVDLKPSEVKVASIDEKFITKSKEIIEQHLSESEFDIEQFAQEMNLTSVVLRRKIKAVTNQSATQFVRKYRLQKAANLLANNADTVSNIAYQVGFESLSYFTKVFQEEFGVSPSEFGK